MMSTLKLGRKLGFICDYLDVNTALAIFEALTFKRFQTSIEKPYTQLIASSMQRNAYGLSIC